MIAKPFDDLQPSPFSIDDWKYRFLASENLIASFQWFWENFDYQGWSIWEIEYLKTENEGIVLLQTKNMVRGFLQSTNPLFKKYCFAIHGVSGDEPDLHQKVPGYGEVLKFPNIWRTIDHSNIISLINLRSSINKKEIDLKNTGQSKKLMLTKCRVKQQDLLNIFDEFYLLKYNQKNIYLKEFCYFALISNIFQIILLNHQFTTILIQYC